jgi:hypothetical protein
MLLEFRQTARRNCQQWILSFSARHAFRSWVAQRFSAAVNQMEWKWL